MGAGTFFLLLVSMISGGLMALPAPSPGYHPGVKPGDTIIVTSRTKNLTNAVATLTGMDTATLVIHSDSANRTDNVPIVSLQELRLRHDGKVVQPYVDASCMYSCRFMAQYGAPLRRGSVVRMWGKFNDKPMEAVVHTLRGDSIYLIRSASIFAADSDRRMVAPIKAYTKIEVSTGWTEYKLPSTILGGLGGFAIGYNYGKHPPPQWNETPARRKLTASVLGTVVGAGLGYAVGKTVLHRQNWLTVEIPH